MPAYYKIGERTWRERYGLNFEEFAPGQRFRHRPGVTLTQQDNSDEALDTSNGAMIHFDAHYAAQTTWRQPLMVSTLTLQKAIGMTTKTFGRRASIRRFDEIAMVAPLFGGDTIYAETEILDILSDDAGSPDTGVLRVLTRVTKPDGTEVARIRYVALIYKSGRGPGGAPGTPSEEPRLAAYHTAEDGALVEQSGLFFEDFEVGDCFIHYPRRSFLMPEAIERARRSLELQPAALDLGWIDAHAAADDRGRLRIGETFLISAAVALTTRTFGRVVANLGWHDAELPRPVFVGDTVEASSRIIAARASQSRPGEGVLSVATRVVNQNDEEVLSYGRNLLVYRRGAAAPYANSGY